MKNANHGAIDNNQLISIIERIEKLNEDTAAIAADIKEVYAEAKSAGYDPKYIRQMIRLRKLDPDELDEADELTKMYRDALGLQTMKKFTKTIENFTCAHCGAEVLGNGYTNHCPKCLWSRHVDNNPGDRQSNCGGMMKPISVEQKAGEFIITHKCEKCGKTIKQHASEQDDMDIIISISSNSDFIFGK